MLYFVANVSNNFGWTKVDVMWQSISYVPFLLFQLILIELYLKFHDKQSFFSLNKHFVFLLGLDCLGRRLGPRLLGRIDDSGVKSSIFIFWPLHFFLLF